ncbi:MAG TPA: MarR family transcriptional regulator [Terriglobales bacterium]|nr:MarR family transcriptional regulator [Terriglobales bacterium]
MTPRLQDEIKQRKPFASLEEEVYLNLQRTADALARRVAAALKPHGLSLTQYNVLRILRGAGNAGLACGEIGERMITRDPDVTRLLDRLEKRGLLQRVRDSRDRRVVMARILRPGLELLDALDAALAHLQKTSLKGLKQEELRNLSELLERARGG